MSEINSNLNVLLINGINTHFGGSLAESNKTWESAFKKNDISFFTLDTVPNFGVRKKSKWYLLILTLYFLPGTFFRIFRSSIFEFFYKISPLLLLKFLFAVISKKPKHIIFSHHSVCYLALFCRYTRRIFLISDLIYVRSRSRGASREAQRLYFYLELCIYRCAPVLYVQSYHEYRLLKRFLHNHIYLISCCEINLTTKIVKAQADIAVISDWRRFENVHGARKFFSTPLAKAYGGKNLNFHFYGFDSDYMVRKLMSERLPSNINIIDKGVFNNLSDIQESYIFVPIYYGAGIKRKTLDSLCAGRVVIGTKGAFIGLPPWIISKVTKRVSSILDLEQLPEIPEGYVFANTLKELSKNFLSIAEISELK